MNDGMTTYLWTVRHEATDFTSESILWPSYWRVYYIIFIFEGSISNIAFLWRLTYCYDILSIHPVVLLTRNSIMWETQKIRQRKYTEYKHEYFCLNLYNMQRFIIKSKGIICYWWHHLFCLVIKYSKDAYHFLLQLNILPSDR